MDYIGLVEAVPAAVENVDDAADRVARVGGNREHTTGELDADRVADVGAGDRDGDARVVGNVGDVRDEDAVVVSDHVADHVPGGVGGAGGRVLEAEARAHGG
jgi:hypothetical protein